MLFPAISKTEEIFLFNYSHLEAHIQTWPSDAWPIFCRMKIDTPEVTRCLFESLTSCNPKYTSSRPQGYNCLTQTGGFEVYKDMKVSVQGILDQ